LLEGNIITNTAEKLAQLPQGLQLVNVFLVVLDILRKLFISIICYPSGIFIGCKASVSSPCLASISKGSMRLKRL